MMVQGTMVGVDTMPTDYALEMPGSFMRAVSPFREMGAYEALWSEAKASFKWMADKFREHPGAVPSDFVPDGIAAEFARERLDTLSGWRRHFESGPRHRPVPDEAARRRTTPDGSPFSSGLVGSR